LIDDFAENHFVETQKVIENKICKKYLWRFLPMVAKTKACRVALEGNEIMD
jgi:hypothetical protein